MSPRERTVFIVDDEAEFRQALVSLLTDMGYRARAFESPLAFLNEVDPETPGCLLLDLNMPVCGGLELQRVLAECSHRRAIVFLTGHATVQASVLAMKAGAVDVLLKPVQEQTLVTAIDLALGRDAEVRHARSVEMRARARQGRLTPREREVLQHLLRGRLNKQIAGALGTAEQTIKVHRSRILRKMGVRSIAELVQLVVFDRDAQVGRELASSIRES